MFISDQEVYEHITNRATDKKRPMAIFDYTNGDSDGKRFVEAIFCDPRKYKMPECARHIRMLCFMFGPTPNGLAWADEYEKSIRSEGASV